MPKPPFKMTIDFRFFLDRTPIERAVDRARLQVLKRGGAFVRTTAKRSIRQRRRVSRPGRPPHSHAGHLRRLIFFAYDPGRRSVVVGPLPFRKGEAPNLLEFSGTAHRDGRRLHYRARPFMGPALEQEAPKFPALWRDSVKG